MSKVKATFNVEEKLVEKFKAMSNLFGTTQSFLINEFIRDWCVSHTAEFNEKLIDLKNNQLDNE